MELSKSIRDLKLILYGNNEAEPVAEACAQLTQEFFKGDTLRRLLTSLPNLNLEVTSRPLMITSKERQLTVCNSSIRRDYLSFFVRPGKMLLKLLQIFRGNKSIHVLLHLIISNPTLILWIF